MRDDFTTAYIECALWSSDDGDGSPMDENYGPEDLAPETLASMEADCAAFQAAWGEKIDAAEVRSDYSNRALAGHDFWLTRNRHGAGFWDGDWPKELGKELTEAAHAFGEGGLYVGDDGRIY